MKNNIIKNLLIILILSLVVFGLSFVLFINMNMGSNAQTNSTTTSIDTQWERPSNYYSLSCPQLIQLGNYWIISYLQSPQSWEPTIINVVNQIIIAQGCLTK